MSIDIDAVQLLLAADIQTALAAAGLVVDVKEYRINPTGQTLEVQVSSYGSLPEHNASGGSAGAELDFVATIYSGTGQETDAHLRTAEQRLNVAEKAIVAAIPNWAETHGWLSCGVFQKSRRPISPTNLVKWRLAGLYIRVKP